MFAYRIIWTFENDNPSFSTEFAYCAPKFVVMDVEDMQHLFRFPSRLFRINVGAVQAFLFGIGEIECFSCMSSSYGDKWDHLKSIYSKPKTFTDRCNEKILTDQIPLIECGSICVTLLEPDLEAGVLIDYKYIRGCVDTLLVHGFNESALQTYRFQESEQCRTLPRAQLYKPGRVQELYGDVTLCSCFGSRCNGVSSATVPRCLSPLLYAVFVYFVKQLLLRITAK